jgi:hypothetical protein
MFQVGGVQMDHPEGLFSASGVIRLIAFAVVSATISFVVSKLGLPLFQSKVMEEVLKKGAESAISSATESPNAYQPANGTTLKADEIFWLSIRDSTAPALFEEFLRKFPKSKYAPEASVRIQQLNAPVTVQRDISTEPRRRCVTFNGREICG